LISATAPPHTLLGERSPRLRTGFKGPTSKGNGRRREGKGVEGRGEGKKLGKGRREGRGGR